MLNYLSHILCTTQNMKRNRPDLQILEGKYGKFTALELLCNLVLEVNMVQDIGLQGYWPPSKINRCHEKNKFE